MKVVLLITLMVSLVLVNGENPRPCMRNWNNNAYNNFVRRHILQEFFDRRSTSAWRTYLRSNGLCNRPRQTFMESRDLTQVKQICRGNGWRRNSYNNLCFSDSRIQVYDFSVDNNCQVRNLDPGSRYVVVACDAIENVCRPSHFQESTSSRPNKSYGRCQ